MFIVVAAAVCVAFGAASPAPHAFGAASPAPLVYPATGIVVDETASLTVGGVAVPLAFEAGSPARGVGPPPLPSTRARWASDAALPCELRVEGTADRWADAALRAAGRDLDFVLLEHGGAVVVRFSLGPGHAYLVDGRGGRRYYFWVDATAAAARPPGAVQVAAGAAGAGWLEAALRKHESVALGPGVHGTDAFALPPGASLFLEAGAVLRYDGPDRDADLGAFVSVSGDGASLAGVGTFDAAGFHGRHVLAEGATNVTVRDVFFQGSRGWGLHFRRCAAVRVFRAKIFSGADGVDPDASRDVALDGVFIHAWDDAVAVKTTVAGSPAANVAVANSIVSTRKSAFKLGTESLSNFTRVSFSKSDVFDSGRGLVIYAKDGGAFDDVAFEDLRLLEFYDYPGEPSAPVDFELEHRSGYSAVRGVRVERVVADWPSAAVLRGNDHVLLSGVAFSNATLKVRAPFAGNATFLFDCKNDDIAAGGVEVAGLDVDWGAHRGAWLGLSRRWADAVPAGGAASLCPDPPGARVAALLRAARGAARGD